MKRSLTLLATLATTFVVARPAHAQATGCGGAQFFICFSSTVTRSGSTVNVSITNTSTSTSNPNSTIAALGVGSGSYAGLQRISTTSTDFDTYCSMALGSTCAKSNANPNSYNGAGYSVNDFFGLYIDPHSSSQGLTDGQSVSFSLIFDNAADAGAFVTGGMQYAFHDLHGPQSNCPSGKAAFDAAGHPIGAPNTASNMAFSPGTCSAIPLTATPEPSSLALLGTGLFGLVPMVRRRRK